MTCPLPPGHDGPCAQTCPATTVDRLSRETTRCRLPAGHDGCHEGACIGWSTPVPGPYSDSAAPDDLAAWRGLTVALRARLTRTQEAARAYLDARDRVDPAGEREARARLETELDDG